MAKADYYLCDVCGEKAFYDADISDSRYEDPIEEGGVDIAVICNDCTKTHKVIVAKKDDAGQNTRQPVTTQEAARKILAGGEWSEFMAAFSAIQDGVDELASPEQILKAAMQALATPDEGAE